MGLENLTPGTNVPDDINVIIEISANSSPVKYEMDKTTGLIKVDRFLTTSMIYPCEYGFIPNTLAEDGDPVDVLVISPYPLLPGVLIRCRPLGVLRMTDESGPDVKIVAVPIDKLTKKYQQLKTLKDVDEDLLRAIEHFFTHYKDLEKDKWAKIGEWEGVDAAKKAINEGVKRYTGA